MKKLVSVLLSAAIIISCISVIASGAEEPDLSFAVASDLHYNVPPEALEGEIDDEIYWYANRRAAMENESGLIIDEFLNQCAENDGCDFILISGDIADHGKTIPQEHIDAAAKFAAFEEKTGKQIYVINGNHDLGEGSDTTREDFMRIYADFGFDEALATDPGTCSYTANLGSKYRLIALDSCTEGGGTADGLTTDKLDWVRIQASQAKADGRYPILMMHHNLLDHMPIQRIFSKNFIVRFHRSTAELFADWGIKLVFTGHEHCSDAASYTSAAGNVIYDFATTSLTMYPLQYRLFELTDSKISYKAATVDSIDTEALTNQTSGYSEKQLSLMNEGLNAYAKSFLKKGVEYRLSLSLSMEKIGIEPGDFSYDLVNTAVSGLLDILKNPLYGENGVSALAKEYNIDIPQSNYENGWDVATELVAAHYAGEEAFSLQSTEVTIFLRLVALVLRHDLADVADKVFLKAANELLSGFGTSGIAADLTKLGSKVLGPVTPVEYFLLALVSPIIYNFAVDSDGINDNHGVLPGYAQVGAEINSANIIENIHSILNNIMRNLSLFLTVIYKMIF